MMSHLAPYLKSSEAIVDVGAGLCDVTYLMMQVGCNVTPLDVHNLSCVPEVQPTLYDGKRMPFNDKAFNTATILTVLHHTSDPEHILREAQRVAKRIIVIEDIYHSTPHKHATFFMDSLLNFEFFGHPHSNKKDQEWRDAFKQLGLKIVDEKSMKSFVVMRHKLYVLET